MLYTVTPSLYSAYYWYKRLEGTTDEDFLNTLRKIDTPKTELMQRGIDFENSILTATETGEYIGDDAVFEIAKLIKGGEWQKLCQRQLNDDVLVKGRIDVYFPDKIYDIKFTDNYDLGKYKYSIQHLVYMYCTDVPVFEYLVGTPSSFYTEHYYWCEDAAQLLDSRVSELLDFIFRYPEFRDAYEANWILHDHTVSTKL